MNGREAAREQRVVRASHVLEAEKDDGSVPGVPVCTRGRWHLIGIVRPTGPGVPVDVSEPLGRIREGVGGVLGRADAGGPEFAEPIDASADTSPVVFGGPGDAERVGGSIVALLAGQRRPVDVRREVVVVNENGLPCGWSTH